MSVVSGASPLVMSVVSLVMCVEYGQTQFPVSGATYNFGATLLTSLTDLEAAIEKLEISEFCYFFDKISKLLNFF
jgi:hypothetical protein